jgi:hypothetical protein
MIFKYVEQSDLMIMIIVNFIYWFAEITLI